MVILIIYINLYAFKIFFIPCIMEPYGVGILCIECMRLNAVSVTCFTLNYT